MGSNHDAAPVSEYVREMVREHILQRGARFRESGARLRALINAGKAWVIAYHRCVAVAAFNSQDIEASWKSKSGQ